MSNDSGFLTASRAFLKAREPSVVESVKLNPCVFADVIALPTALSRCGSNPSNPSCIGTVNLRYVTCAEVVRLTSVPLNSLDRKLSNENSF